MTIRYKKIISMLLVLVVAVVTGVSVGMIYVDRLEVAAVVGAAESELRESETKVEELVKKSATSSVTSFSPLELYLIAEYNLNHNDFYKLMTGTVYAAANVTQKMKGERLKRDGVLVYNKLSPSTSSLAPSICSRIVYDYNAPDAIKVIPTGSFVYRDGDFFGSFSDANAKVNTAEQYKETFNTLPTSVLPYIISSITTSAAQVSATTKNPDGTYTFSFKLSGDLLTLAALYYSYEIRFSSGMADLPIWKSLTLTATVDSHFRFVKIEYDEVYRMNAPVIGWTDVNDKFVEKMQYTNLPSISSVLGEDAA